jgi:hypothetical protein
MAHAITITDPTIIAIIEEEAQKRGLTPADAVKQIIVAHQPDQASITPQPDASDETPEERQARLERAHQLIREMQAMMTDEDRAFDYDAWLYDENGMPH